MAKAFPTDNPFLRGYYGPVNTEIFIASSLAWPSA